MRTPTPTAWIGVIGILCCSHFSFSQHAHDGHTHENPNNGIRFVVNQGQWPDQVQYRAGIPGGAVWLEGNSLLYDFIDQTDLASFEYAAHHPNGDMDIASMTIHRHALRVDFVGANEAHTEGIGLCAEYHNYLLGNDRTKWASEVPLYKKTVTRELYSGIDLEMYAQMESGSLKYDLVVQPNADPNQIELQYEGADAIDLVNGEIHITLSVGEVIEGKPFAFQRSAGRLVEVPCDYVLDGDRVRFHFPEGYDASRELIIDPVLIFSTYSGSTADNWGFTATYNLNGNLFGGGIAFGFGYPTTAGAYQTAMSGGTIDVSITKYTTDGSAIVYATYLGGNNQESPHSLIVDDLDNLIIMGSTSSSNFPTTAGAYDQTFNGGSSVTFNGLSYTAGSDIFVTKLDPTGGSLVGSTFLGGTQNDGINNGGALRHNYADEARGEVILDPSGDIYVSSCTYSSDFPTTAGSLAQTNQGGLDGFAVKLSSDLTTLVWGTYLGGSLNDAAYSIKVRNNGDAVVCGGTLSLNFPTSVGALNPAYGGGTTDGFVMTLDNTGDMISSTYLGTAAYDQAFILETDDDGDVYVVGQTLGAYPVTGGVYSNPGSAQFIHKLTADLTTSAYSTVIGTGSTSSIDISLTAFLVDDCENVYLSGWGGSTNYSGSTTGLPITGDAYQSTTNGSDFYFMVLERDVAAILYGSFFGGASTAEHVDGGTSRFDKNGIIYQAVCAGCGGSSAFPTTAGAWSNTNNSSNCNMGTLKMEFSYPGINAVANVSDLIACSGPPYDVTFDGSSSAVDHFWDFGDGVGTSTLEDPIYTYADTGTYTIMYVAIDSSTCNIADTAYATIQVIQPDTLDAQINIGPWDPCEPDSMNVQLVFTGTGADSLVWDMGDGTIYINDTMVDHNYTSQGFYYITMTGWDQCGNVTTIIDSVDYSGSGFNVNVSITDYFSCSDPPINVPFTGDPAVPNHYWDFGDGNNSTLQDPIHTYADTGTYVIMYVGIDSASCNIADTAFATITLSQAEQFSAEWEIVPPGLCEDTLIIDVAFSGSGADSLVWDMGDGTIFINVDSVDYFYTIAGTYTVSLTVYDTVCNNVGVVSQTFNYDPALIGGQIHVPNVFSPNGDGYNDTYRLGYLDQPFEDPMDDMEEYHIQIFNRWGKLVFESGSTVADWQWDGKIDGSDAAEGVYYYILNYKYICEEDPAPELHGHITIVR